MYYEIDKYDKIIKLLIDDVQPTTEDVLLECWSDDDFTADKTDHKSVSGCVLTLDGFVILWLCKKHSGISLSTIEAEFISTSQAGCELLDKRKLCNELKLRVREPTPMWIDNQATIKHTSRRRAHQAPSTYIYGSSVSASMLENKLL